MGDMNPKNKYTEMQKKSYAGGVYNDSVKRAMDGEDPGKGDHFGPLNNLDDMHNFLFAEDGGLALDFGCGPGRAIVRYADRFNRIDGTDISKENLSMARAYTNSKGLNPVLWECNGVDLRSIPSELYNTIFSIQVFPHICVHDIRYSLLKEFYRVLVPGGWIGIQMGYGEDGPSGRRLVPYFGNDWDAKGTNGYLDCTVNDPSEPAYDFKQIGFKNFSYDLGDMTWKHANHHQWIYLRAQK
jgi:SAM-dependent methyltransferase